MAWLIVVAVLWHWTVINTLDHIACRVDYFKNTLILEVRLKRNYTYL